jgi:PPK2 family polyphosphate:nucleotide phosphotransferase
MKTARLAKNYRINDGKHFRLKDFDPADTGHWKSEGDAKGKLQKDIDSMADLQAKLYAQDQWSLLLIFQAMDAAGKDGTIKHVMSGVNPEGCQVYSFKTPSESELQHDFLWRTTCDLPERGHIGIFNRSYYEEVLVVRVHQAALGNEKLPPKLVTKQIWKERFEDIHCFERHMARSGTVIRKFFLHLSKKEQRRRFLARLDEPEKHWKFSEADIHERDYWDDYQQSYEEMIQNTASHHAPWYVVPADNKWFTHLVVAAAIVEAMEELDLCYPKVDAVKLKGINAARRILSKKESFKSGQR